MHKRSRRQVLKYAVVSAGLLLGDTSSSALVFPSVSANNGDFKIQISCVSPHQEERARLFASNSRQAQKS
ncbi:MAG TPA: hypothetical protein VL128_03760 [Candidatus Eisenbacteria bacterium]|nr:hypothetical protein [Candidatus Eisenbacteria bacterium]